MGYEGDEMFAIVTGADGFIGSHLVEKLLREGHRVRALALYNSFGSWGWLDDVAAHDNLEIVMGDVRDPFLCREICQGVDTVFHLASLIAIPYSYRAPQSYVETNVTGTLNMCEGAKSAGVKRFVQTSTSEVYGTARFVPITEEHPLQPQSPYSASKIGADQMALSYYYSFGLPVAVARPFNTYGPRQSARAILPTVIAQIAAGNAKIQVGDTTPSRDFNFVEDTVAGLVAIAQSDQTIGEVTNIGSGREIKIADAISLIASLMKVNVTVDTDSARLRPADSEVQRLLCDASKLKQRTGCVSSVSLEAGLERTIKWFREPANLKKYKTSIYNI